MSGLTREATVSLERRTKAVLEMAPKVLTQARLAADEAKAHADREVARLRSDCENAHYETHQHIREAKQELFMFTMTMRFIDRAWWLLTGKLPKAFTEGRS